MHSEPTQRGNPHRLTVKQHVFPVASIRRFCTSDGRVSVKLLQKNKVVSLFPEDILFCARRTWDQRSEQGFMRQVENSFQELADAILNQNSKQIKLEQHENRVVSHFYSLCRLRAEARQSPAPDVQVEGVLLGKVLTKDEEEILEKNWYSFSRGTTILGRQMASIRIQILLDKLCKPNTTWAVVQSNTVDFLVPDYFGSYGVVPLTPNICLVANAEGGQISSKNAIEINRIASAQASLYYFASDLARCAL